MQHEVLTRDIIGSCYDVGKELGHGFLESVYEKSLCIALQQRGLKVRTQVPLTVTFREQIVGEFYADLLVDDKVLIELKTVTDLSKAHMAQLLNYLKATGIEIGLLVNFGTPKVQIRRLHWSLTRDEIYDLPPEA